MLYRRLFMGKGILFTDKDILSGFKRRLERATRVRIATAWATPGLHLDALGTAVQENELEVRAVVGTHGNATDPAALERLKELGKLRLAEDAPLFHPKIYVFEFRSGKPVAWVGSANFTRAGFGDRNVETMYETKGVKPFLEWFKQQWRQSEPASRQAIDDYRQRREENPPDPASLKVVGEPEGTAPGPSLQLEAQTWDPVLDPEEIRAAFDRMRATLVDGAEEFKDWTVRGDRVMNDTVYWRTDPGYWCAFADPDSFQRRQGYWNCFGLENPGHQPGQAVDPIILELNPPLDGNSERAGYYAGLFVRNDHGGIFLARNLKSIQGVNSEDLERRSNERLPGRIVDVLWRRRRTRRMVILGEVGSGELRNTVAELVRLVAELRAAGEAP